MKLFYTVSLSVGVAIASPLFPRAPVVPSSDPFYIQPANIAQYEPGQVIETRDVPPSLGGFTGLTREPIKEMLQVKYRTTDSLHNPVAAVASILVPTNANTSQLLVYEQAYDSSNVDCSPSYALQTGANNTALADIAFISAALNKGYYVVTADYEGLLAQFVAGPMAGYATLDSARAALNLANSKKINLSPTARYAMWGYSGGSLACEWAAELQPSYAPELTFSGSALGGLIPNVTSVLLTIDKGPFSGLAFSGISGLNKTLPETNSLYEESIISEKKADFESIASGCFADVFIQGGGKDIFSYFKQGMATVYDQRFQDTINYAGLMGTHGVPNHPLYAYKAMGDEVSPAADTDKLVNTLCSKGAVIEYHRDTIGEHATELIFGSVNAFSWLADRLDGKPVANAGCLIQNVTITEIGPGDPEAFTTEIISLLESLLGSPFPLGPIASG